MQEKTSKRKFKHPMLWLSAAFLASVVACSWLPRASEDVEMPRERAVIHFADLHGIQDWKAVGSDAILIEGRNHRWYRASFYGPCLGLQFEQTIGFVTEPTGDLDAFSSILVGDDRCWFRSFEEIEEPDEATS